MRAKPWRLSAYRVISGNFFWKPGTKFLTYATPPNAEPSAFKSMGMVPCQSTTAVPTGISSAFQPFGIDILILENQDLSSWVLHFNLGGQVVALSDTRYA